MKLHDDIGYTFDDFLIRPAYSELNSRLDVDVFVTYREKTFCPIIAANMSTIATLEMQHALAKKDCIVPFHRFQSIEDEVYCLKHAKEGNAPIAATVGLNDRNRIKAVADHCEWLFLELAHAHTQNVIQEVDWILKEFSKHVLVVGNIATGDASRELFYAGANIIKCGVGPGSCCVTRGVTGCGVPQVSALEECCRTNIPIIADGGMKASGDMVKAIALGAQFLMTGYLLAGTEETVGSGNIRTYCGSASKEDQTRRNGKLPKGIVPEGVSAEVSYKGSAEKVIDDLIAGIRQGMSMVGAKNIKELREKAVFQRVSQNSVIEGTPYILR